MTERGERVREEFEREKKRAAKIIEKCVSYFNGWRVEDSTMKENSESAAGQILLYLKRRDSQLKASAYRTGQEAGRKEIGKEP